MGYDAGVWEEPYCLHLELDSKLNQTSTAYVRILYVWLFISHPIFRCCMILTLKA